MGRFHYLIGVLVLTRESKGDFPWGAVGRMDSMFWFVILPTIVLLLWVPFAAWSVVSRGRNKKGGSKVSEAEYRRALSESAEWEKVNPYGEDEEKTPSRKRSRRRRGKRRSKRDLSRARKQSSSPPPANVEGEWDAEGHEWIEHPRGSDVWWWRDHRSGNWNRS